MTNALHDVRPTTWAPSDTTFGARLALLRQHMRWGNVAEAARQCGLPVESWRNWEEGKRPRDLTEVAKAIADRTACDVDWLVWGPSRAQLAQRMAVTLRYPADLPDVMTTATIPRQHTPAASLHGPLPNKMTYGPISRPTAASTDRGRPSLVRPQRA